MQENNLITNKHILIYSKQSSNNHTQEYLNEIDFVINNFCGKVIFNLNELDLQNISKDRDIFVCGNIGFYSNQLVNLTKNQIYVIQEISTNYLELITNIKKIKVIELGQVPINIFNVGVYFRKLFGGKNIFFDSIVSEHEFQTLTESNKPTNAFRTGIYISKVEPVNIDSDELEFHLLRCSSNLSGSTDNVRPTDTLIMKEVNEMADKFFESKTSLNHILAQVYTNSVGANENDKDKKDKIKAHSDKTKDMPTNGLMEFCSFYENFNGETFEDYSKDNESDDEDKNDSDNEDDDDESPKHSKKIKEKFKMDKSEEEDENDEDENDYEKDEEDFESSIANNKNLNDQFAQLHSVIHKLEDFVSKKNN